MLNRVYTVALEQFFFTAGQNNFGIKIPFFLVYLEKMDDIQQSWPLCPILVTVGVVGSYTYVHNSLNHKTDEHAWTTNPGIMTS